MQRILLASALLMTVIGQAHAWGLSEIGGKLLQKGVETTVNSAVNADKPQPTAQTGEAAPTTVDGVATTIAADTASQAATDAMSKSGIPGAGVAGSVAGGLVKGFGGMFKKKSAEEQPVNAQPQQ